jgi:hypothetical protein
MCWSRRILAQPNDSSLGFEVVANSPDEFAARIKAEMEKWGKVILDAKLKVENAQ